jgi:hypothetical protein
VIGGYLPDGGSSVAADAHTLIRMSLQPTSTTLVNPRPQAVRLVLSDGSERIVPPWGLAILPRSGVDGQPLSIVQAFALERRVIPGQIEASDFPLGA